MVRLPARASEPPRELRSQKGFTLIELLVTLVILGMVATLGLPHVSGRAGKVGLASDARALASRLRAAREIALAARSNAAVTIDLAQLQVHGPADWPSYDLVATDRVSVHTAKGQVTEQAAEVKFWPDGGSSGSVVILGAGDRSQSVRVDWLTGAVSIKDASQ